MKQLWLRYAAKIDALGLRERVLIFVMTAVILIALVNTLVLGEQFSKQLSLAQQIAQDQSQIAGIQTEIRAKVAAYDSNPDAVKQAQLNQLTHKSDQMRSMLQDMQKGLVSSDRMSALLEDILKQNSNLHLRSLRTLPVSGLNDPEPPEKTESEKTPPMSAAEIDMRKLSAPASAPSLSTSETKKNPESGSAADLVYKHGVEIVIEGSYLDMVTYMTALEKMPWQLFWSRAKLVTQDSGKLSLTLRLYTLSLEKKWLNI
jgi:MSHA biogenesis protein MshJ